MTHDPVHHPSHYTGHPSGIECIQVTEHLSFCVGNAIKYLWRAGSKGDVIEDLEKARWYVDREIERQRDLVKPTYEEAVARLDRMADEYEAQRKARGR